MLPFLCVGGDKARRGGAWRAREERYPKNAHRFFWGCHLYDALKGELLLHAMIHFPVVLGSRSRDGSLSVLRACLLVFVKAICLGPVGIVQKARADNSTVSHLELSLSFVVFIRCQRGAPGWTKATFSDAAREPLLGCQCTSN